MVSDHRLVSLSARTSATGCPRINVPPTGQGAASPGARVQRHVELGAKSIVAAVALAVAGGLVMAGAVFRLVQQKLAADRLPVHLWTEADQALAAGLPDAALVAPLAHGVFAGGEIFQLGGTVVGEFAVTWGEQAAGNRFHGDDVPVAPTVFVPVATKKFAGSTLPEPPAPTTSRPGQAASSFAAGREIVARLGPERELVVLAQP